MKLKRRTHSKAHQRPETVVDAAALGGGVAGQQALADFQRQEDNDAPAPAVARTVAREQKIPLNDLRRAFVDYWRKHNPDNQVKGILTYDGNHFNETVHKFVAEQMLKKLK